MKCKAVGYILENDVRHARLLPTISAHAFSYKTLSLFLPLSALEAHELELGGGWLFGYDNAAPLSLTRLRPESYLSAMSEKESLRAKLEEVLERFGQDSKKLRDAWMQTMPRYMGFEGINPLTVYYCYSHQNDDLWTVVLEVHNTFGEQHVYVLPVGPESEDKLVHQGFDHAWTFPRQFHVSPFNDRSGYYTCSIVVPPHPPDVQPSKPSTTPSLPPSVRIELRTAQTRDLKLIASLRPTRLTPFTSRSLLLALARQPFVLFLSFARIVWHAAILHYGRRLDVYVRPEPRAVSAALETMLPMDQNAVQRASGFEGDLGVGGGTGWQPEGMLERYARRRVEAFIAGHAREVGITVVLESANPEYGRKSFSGSKAPDADAATQEEKHLHITFRSSRFFTILLTCPSAAHSLLLGHDAERLFSVSDEILFLVFFSSNDSKPLQDTNTFRERMDLRRLTQVRRLQAVPPSLRKPPSRTATVPAVHPLDTSLSFFSLRVSYYVVGLILFMSSLERILYTVFRARFVPGTEPWAGWQRAEEAVWKTTTKATGADVSADEKRDTEEASECPPWLGSVRRP